MIIQSLGCLVHARLINICIPGMEGQMGTLLCLRECFVTFTAQIGL